MIEKKSGSSIGFVVLTVLLTPGRYTLDLTARPHAAYLLTLVTQDGHRHTVRLLKQSEVFGQ